MRSTLTTPVRQDDDLITPADLADHLGIPEQTVYRWRGRGIGPRGIKVGRYLRYRWADVKIWLDANADPAA